MALKYLLASRLDAAFDSGFGEVPKFETLDWLWIETFEIFRDSPFRTRNDSLGWPLRPGLSRLSAGQFGAGPAFVELGHGNREVAKVYHRSTTTNDHKRQHSPIQKQKMIIFDALHSCFDCSYLSLFLSKNGQAHAPVPSSSPTCSNHPLVAQDSYGKWPIYGCLIMIYPFKMVHEMLAHQFLCRFWMTTPHACQVWQPEQPAPNNADKSALYHRRRHSKTCRQSMAK